MEGKGGMEEESLQGGEAWREELVEELAAAKIRVLSQGSSTICQAQRRQHMEETAQNKKARHLASLPAT